MVGILNITDVGHTFSGKAQETISGGQLVKGASGATVLPTTGKIDNSVELLLTNAAGDNAVCVGVAETNAASGERLTVKTTGIHGFYAAGGVTAGDDVGVADAVTTADAVLAYAKADVADGSKIIGTAISEAASGQLVAVKLNL